MYRYPETQIKLIILEDFRLDLSGSQLRKIHGQEETRSTTLESFYSLRLAR